MGVAIVAVIGAVLVTGRANGPLRTADGRVATGLPSASPSRPGHEVYGFVPYWEIDNDIAAHLRETDATTIALFSVTHTGKGTLGTTHSGYRRIDGPIGRQVIAEAHQRGRRVDATWTSFGKAKNRSLFGTQALQDKVIASLVAFRAELDLDGLAVDVESIDDADIPAYGAFIERLRAALVAANPAATLTVATGAGRQGAALALAASLAGADRIFLMGYDYRTASSQPGASAPIARRDGDERSLAWSLDLYAGLGIPSSRTILGLPLYGLAWPTADAEVGAPSTGGGDIWVPRRNLATLRDPAVTTGYDDIEDVGFLARRDGASWQSIYYDTPRSLRPKLGLANDRGLAGAGFWALGYERGLPEYTDLIAAFRLGQTMTVAAGGP
ncbi:MAG: glycoside hydrolase family 18 protein [Chloroflexi bacterium]|nr:glycoside hydrolase family 18 protein [Chloroflexota bacterium]